MKNKNAPINSSARLEWRVVNTETDHGHFGYGEYYKKISCWRRLVCLFMSDTREIIEKKITGLGM